MATDLFGWILGRLLIGPQKIHTRMTRAFKRVPTCHIGSAVHFIYCGLLAFEGHNTMKMDSWTYVTCRYSFESSCHPGVDSGNQFNAQKSCWFPVPLYQCALHYQSFNRSHHLWHDTFAKGFVVSHNGAMSTSFNGTPTASSNKVLKRSKRFVQQLIAKFPPIFPIPETYNTQTCIACRKASQQCSTVL